MVQLTSSLPFLSGSDRPHSTKDIRIRFYPLSTAFPNLYGFGGSDPRVSVDERPKTYQKAYGFERIRVSVDGPLFQTNLSPVTYSVNWAHNTRSSRTKYFLYLKKKRKGVNINKELITFCDKTSPQSLEIKEGEFMIYLLLWECHYNPGNHFKNRTK